MSAIALKRFVISNILTLYYGFITLFGLAIAYLKNPFKNPWELKLVLVPPANLTDPKYGVHKYVKANNIKFHYVESGDPSKPLMLFLHGFPEFWYSWRHQIVEFNKDYWCVAVDMRGFGDSERPEGVSSYKMELLVEDVHDLLQKLGRKKCILVAHDWGGIIATKFRDVHPEALEALILLGTTSVEAWTQEVWENPDQRKKSWYIFFYRLPMLPELIVQMNDLQMFDILFKHKNTTVKDSDIECYKYWFRKQYALTPPINYYRANFQVTSPEKYKNENIPMLIANGEHDPFIGQNLLKRVKNEYKYIETMLVENCYHFLQQESPEKINTIIKDFLTKHNM
ncbi:epoxide hydrolase 3-like [Battus philenor]|uniref:epoxide hydrolase 3-like n=1 Tax=Battus philenor TaxID=42288 RepID=UPI0035CFD6D5